jgi:hypothetical protein
VKIDWSSVIQYVIGAGVVSWPPVVFGFWLGWRKTRAHVDKVTSRQTEQIAELTDAQTSEIAGALERRHQARPGGYHGHGEEST